MNDSIVNLLPQLALAVALSWGAGLRLYAVLFLVGLAQFLGWVELPEPFALLSSPMVLWASGFIMAIEFLADKVPWVDSIWDAVHTVIRIPAGAALAAAMFGDAGAASALAMAIVGGTVAAGSHFTKAGARAAANTSPEPFSNWTLSLSEDAMVPGALWLAFTHPLALLVLVALFLVAALLFVRWLARGVAEALS